MPATASATAIRKRVIELVYRANASHIGSCLSAVDLLDAIFRHIDAGKIASHSEDRDRVILSKGHAAAAMFATLGEYGVLDADLLRTYFTNGSTLAGHVTHHVPGIEHSTGALGHGLSVAVGMAIGLTVRQSPARVFVVVGDGEMQEGSNWEALMLAGHLRLENLVVLIDANCLGGVACVADCCTLEPLSDRLTAFGHATAEIDGHDPQALDAALANARTGGRPFAVICRTVKGKGVPFMEGQNVWHYRPLNAETYEQAMSALQKDN